MYFWEIEVGYTIANIGTADAGPFNAQIKAGDVPDPNPVIAIAPPNIIQDISDNDPDPYIAIGGASFSGLAAGDTSSFLSIVSITTSGGVATSDPHNPDLGVLITVDSDNEVIESNEENNDLWKLSYPKADLMVKSFDSISVSYGVVNTTIIFTIANYGIADAGPFKVLVSADPELSQQETVNVVSLAYGSSTTLTVILPGSSCFDPDCNVCITVDSDNEVIESNEENNDFCELTIG
jgi:subtilase family serine protease